MSAEDVLGITDDDREDAEEVFDAMLETFGKNCRIYYPSLMTDCDCSTDPIGNKPPNTWVSGGRVKYGLTQNCQLCGGSGKKAQEVTEEITMVIYWNPKEYIKYLPNLQLPAGVVMTRGYMTDFPKIAKSEYAILATDMEPYKHFRFKKCSEMVDYGMFVKGKYFLMFWERA